MLAKIYVSVLLVGAVGATGCVVDMGEVEESEVEQGILGPPATVTITAASPDRVNLSWSAVNGAIKYYIYKATDVNGPYAFENTARAPLTELQIAHLTPGQNYCFGIRTEDGTGPGAMSTPACTSTSTGPGAPDTVIAYQAAPTTIDVDWSAMSGVSKYYVYRSNAINGTYSYLTTVFPPATTYLNTGLTENTTYCYKVAVDSAGFVSPLSVGHCNTSVQPPRDVTATRTSSTRIRVDFTQVPTGFKYFVYESRNGGPYANVATVLQSSPPTAQRANLVTGSTYCYRLQTQNTALQLSPLSLPAACATP